LDHYLKTGDKKAAMDGENLSLLSPLPELYVIENNLIIEEQREAHEKEDDEEAAGQEGEGQEPGDESESLMDMEAEACLLVSLIKEITARQYYDRENELIRQVDYRDIVVLLRSTRNSAAVILEHLISEGIPAYADVNNGYFETIEIEIFMNLLKIIDNKRQDIPLLSVMRSPIGGFSIEEFVQIRLAYPRDNGQVPAFYQALIQYSEDYNDELSSKLQFFLEKIKKWKAEARYMRMDEYIWKLFMDSGYYYYVGAMPGGEQRQANLRILIDRARQFQRTSIRGLFNFIKFVERIRSGSGDLGSARILGENDNVVRIMSIHKSKGLEFPVMIIAGLGKRFNNTDVTGPVLFHRELGLGPRYVDPVLRIRRDTLPRMIIKKRVKLENLAEEMRILYVACTRPQDKLFLVGTVRKLESCLKKWKKEPAPHNLSLGQNYLDWIMPVLMHHRDGSRLRELAGIPGKNNIIPDESRWRIEIIKGVQGNLGTRTESSEIEDFKNRLLGNDLQAESEKRELVWSRLDWQYPYKQSATIPSKLSVTAIKNLQTGMLAGDGNLPEGDLKMTLRERKLEGKREISAAQKGTLMHFVMRHLELSRVHSREEIEAQINEMIAGELLREEEAFIIDIAKIEGFFRTPLGKRILAAAHVYREVPFNLLISARELMKDTDSDEQLLVQGVIDLYFREGNEMVLVDYKSDWVTPETQESVIDKYRVQLEWYKKALERIQGKKVKESFLYLFALGREIRID
ncbi:MAG: 3'-5' exonuclease, partial [Syntrophomonas sp.]